MAPNIITEVDSQLASLNAMKAPGASKTKILAITALCVNNIQAESELVQSLYRAVKKALPTHKLGAIYVIDSVVRKWIEQAKQNGQDLHIEGRGEPGTYPAAVKRVTELMPALFEDTFKNMPAEQREKLGSMVRIWEKGSTFPAKMLADFQTRLAGEAAKPNGTQFTQNFAGSGQTITAPLPTRPLSTPVGYPPPHLYEQGFIKQMNGAPAMNSQPQPQPTPQQQPQAQQPTQNVSSILAALANIPKPAPQPQPQQQQAPQHAPAPQQSAPGQVPQNLAALFGQVNMSGTPSLPPFPPQQQQPSYATPQPGQPFQLPPGFSGFPPQPPPSIPQHYAQAPPPQQPPPQQADPLAPVRGFLPQNIINDPQKLQQALKLLLDLQQQGIPMDQWGPVIEAFASQHQAPTQGGYDTYARGRSRSPERGGGRRRGSPVYGAYGANGRNQDGGRDRYRQRSPMRNSPMPGQGGSRAMNGMPMQPKFIRIDSSMPPNHIKVLSRTLFVGGANGSQQEINDLFERFGTVQTCIANRDKRHAFVKMTTREHALNAKENLERLQSSNDREVMSIARQTKWGVGFGPRECCNYQKGESVIPIEKLTDADNKWLLTAEYGGTGGQPVEGGMVLEEPDIEIGAGVSSKAMSKRVLPDAGPPHKRQRNDDAGPRNAGGRDRRAPPGYGQGGYGYGAQQQQQQQQQPMQMEAYGYARPEPVAVATPPAVPGFGFSLPGAGGHGGYR
ncbi:uncharacterized protein LTR77_002956 [Saxophila tyrrhenica]|uniref:Uncharacterized protein n=1 Tax=Saxophila tyrrhenica TaxID=1690608 RepID=A0AAV9PG27_9PEZI|nr:hypothetical protein LTR77_002956 [Saxophila tyrrhenica]